MPRLPGWPTRGQLFGERKSASRRACYGLTVVASAASQAASAVESTAEAAFATDADGRIVAWNGAAERLLGVVGDRALGRPCHQVVSGLDALGNPFCGPNCAPRERVRSREPVRAFPLDVKQASGEFIRVEVCIVALRAEGSSRDTLVHLLRPVSDGAESDASLEGMRIRASRCGETCAPRVASRHQAAAGDSRLTARETQVLRLLAGGRNPRQVAAGLGVSLHTVRTHVRNVLRKLGVHSATQAVTQALRRRLV